MTTWKALTGRISLFSGGTSPGPSISVMELYRKAWGIDPENLHSSANVVSPSIAQGKMGGLMVGCVMQPTRVDFNLSPVPTAPDVTDLSLSVIEDTHQLHSELARLVEFVGTDTGLSRPINRVGVYVHFVAEERTIEDANKTLLSVIPAQYRLQITGEEDFILQINRPDVSHEVEGVRMNYITKWSLDRFQIFNITMMVGSPPTVGPHGIAADQSQTFIAASVVYDMNNTPVNVPLDRRQQSLLLHEGLVATEKQQREMGLIVGGF